MNNFFLTSLKSLKQTGTVTPSSKHLIQKMTRSIDFNKGLNIVEFGTGNACVTEVLVKKMNPNAQLHSFELNPDFYAFSKKKLKGVPQPQLTIYNENALDFEKAMGLNAPESIDYFISSLPLTLLKNEDIGLLMDRIKVQLKPDGKFIQFQYSWDKLAYFKKHFSKVQLAYALRNLPPAFIYTCSK